MFEKNIEIIDGKLPDNLSVDGGLHLSGTEITELPDNLNVGGHLDLEGTKITKLPDNLSVGGGLYLSGTEITELPDNLSVGKGLYLSNTKITELPDNLSVGGYLGLEGTNISGYPIVYNCGTSDREIYLDLQDKSLIHIGCFRGTQEEAIKQISGECSGEAKEKYISQVNECFGMQLRNSSGCKG